MSELACETVHTAISIVAPQPRLRAEGRLRDAVRIAVRSSEAPPELLAASDIVVDGPAALATLLSDLAASLS